jgi:CRP/FNR family transcriptional regulator
MGDLAKFLKQLSLFSELSDEQLNRIKEISIVRNYTRGAVIFNPSQKAEGFYILKRGKVKIYKSSRGKEQIIRIFSRPTFFGEAASFTGGNFPAWAETIENSEILFIPRTEFLELLKGDPEIGMKLLAVMAQRLIYLTGLIESLSLKDALSKVSSYILRNSKEMGNDEFKFSTNIAAMELGLTKETVSRMLSKLKSMGIIEKNSNLIRIKNKNALLELSE